MSKWNRYFYNLCCTVAGQVQCPSRQIGVIIAKGKLVVATGYNGPPSGFPHPTTCVRRERGVPSGEQLTLCPCSHAERNAIASAAQLGVLTARTTLYINNVVPCFDCACSIVAAGIKTVVVEEDVAYPQPGFTGRDILMGCGVGILEFKLERLEEGK